MGEHFHNFRTHPDERPYVGAQIYRNDAGAQLRSVRLEDSMSCTLEVCRRHTWRHGWMAQGDFYAGISLGYDLRLFLPLNISAFEVKDNKLKDWCKSWMGSDYSPPLEPARTGSGRDTSLVFISGPHLQRQYW